MKIFARFAVFLMPTLIAGAQEQAKSAARFLDSVGVNTHLTYTDTMYGDSVHVTEALQHLGVQHVRDGYGAASVPLFKELAANGIHFTLNVEPPYSAAGLRATVDATSVNGVPSIEAWEGPNELDIQDANWVSDFPVILSSLRAASPYWIPVLGPPLAYGFDASHLSPVQTNYGSMHPYPAGQDPANLFPSQVNLIQPVYPNTPIISSETGYHNAWNGQNDQPAIDYPTGAKYEPRLLLESFNAGVYRTFLYELFDEQSWWNMALKDWNFAREQCHWGLADAAGWEKPAFVAVSNLLAVVRTGDAEVGAPTTLNYTLSGGGSNLHHLLLQKAPHVFDLIVWQDAVSWNTVSLTEIYNPPQTVSLAVNASSVRTFLPSASTSGTQVQAGSSGYSLMVPDEALVVEIVTN